jgi:hypothetical protein
MAHPFFKGFLEGFKEFSLTIASITNFILLFITYFIGIGLTSIFMKIFGKKFLDLNLKKDSYWLDKKIGQESRESYYNQF